VRRTRLGVHVSGFLDTSKFTAQVSKCLKTVLGPQALREHVGVAISVDISSSNGPILGGGSMELTKRMQFEQCITIPGISIPRHADIKIIEER